MDNALKQRVLGVIVLFALIGICITVLLHNNKVQRQAAQQDSRQLIIKDEAPLSTPAVSHHHRTSAVAPQQTNIFTQPTIQQQAVSPPPPAPTNTVAQEQAQNNIPSPAVEEHAIPLETSTSAAPAIHHTIAQQAKPKSKPITSSTFSTKTTEAKTNTKAKTITTKAWSVQVGTFSAQQNATSLVKALKGRGFTASTQSIKTKHGEMTRVVIGANGLTRQEAESIKLHLSKTLQLHGILSPVTKKTTERKNHTTTASKAKTTAHKAPVSHKPANTESASANSDEAPISTAKPSYNNTHSSSNTGADNSGAVVIP